MKWSTKKANKGEQRAQYKEPALGKIKLWADLRESTGGEGGSAKVERNCDYKWRSVKKNQKRGGSPKGRKFLFIMARTKGETQKRLIPVMSTGMKGEKQGGKGEESELYRCLGWTLTEKGLR